MKAEDSKNKADPPPRTSRKLLRGRDAKFDRELSQWLFVLEPFVFVRSLAPARSWGTFHFTVKVQSMYVEAGEKGTQLGQDLQRGFRGRRD